jgi:hypothetical protein
MGQFGKIVGVDEAATALGQTREGVLKLLKSGELRGTMP